MARDSLGEVEHLLLLAVVRMAGNAYGVTIRREIETQTGRELAVGALYLALDRLERKGFVRSTFSAPTPERGGRSRRQYRLTTLGAAALKRSRGRLLRMWDGVPADLRSVRS